MNKGNLDTFLRTPTVKNLHRSQISLDPPEQRTRKYFTVVARDISAHEAFAMEVMFPTKSPRDGSRRSHIHGSNRNRITLHVMLKGRRNRACCSR